MGPASPPLLGMALCWTAVCSYWAWHARRTKAIQRTEPAWQRLLAYWLPLAVAAALLAPWPALFEATPLGRRFVPPRAWIAWLGLLACCGGTVLAIHARRMLGRDWSATVQLKQGQRLIQSGAYRWIRHPIYTGFLLLFAGTALAWGQWRGLLALAIVAASFWRKLRLEERWLGEHFGQAYAQYRRRSKALLPWLL